MTPVLNPRHEQWLVRIILWTMTAVTIAVLVFIIAFILRKGLPAVNLDFLLENPADMGKKGGIFSTIVASTPRSTRQTGSVPSAVVESISESISESLPTPGFESVDSAP